MNIPVKFTKALRVLAPYAFVAILATLPGACGGGGGGFGPPTLGTGTADIVITNSSMMNTGMTQGNFNCTDGIANIYTIESVTVTSTTTGAARSYTFPSPIAVGASQPILGGVPPGDTYSVKATYTGLSALIQETDQCPIDGFLAVAGTNTIVMQY